MITRKHLSFVFIAISILIVSCKKSSNGDHSIINPIDSSIFLKVNTSDVIATGVSNKIGINVNTMRDNDVNLPGARPLTEALKELRVKHLRFPGGGKSNRYFWAKAPYTDASTNYFLPGWYADASTGSNYTLLNFDQFMTICKTTDAIPHVNVACGLPDEPGSASLNKDLAAAWVKYSNITKGYGVRFWEIGK